MFSVIPDPYGAGADINASMSFVQFNGRRVTFRTPYNNVDGGAGALDLLTAASATLDECAIDIDEASSNWSGPPASPGPTSNAGTALILPGDYNWAGINVSRTTVVGYAKGIVHAEHAYLNDVGIDQCGAALAPGSLASLDRAVGYHGCVYGKVLIQTCGVYLEPLGQRRIVGFIEIEQPEVSLINDPDGYLTGDLMIGGITYSGDTTGSQLYVAACGPDLIIRNAYNPYPALGLTAVNDTLLTRATGSSTPFGLADGSGHAWSPVAPSGSSAVLFKIDANGAFMPPGAGTFCITVIQKTPQWTSRLISATIKTSANAGHAFAGLTGQRNRTATTASACCCRTPGRITA